MRGGAGGGRQLTTGARPRIFLVSVLAKAAMTRDADAKNDGKTPRLYDRRIVERNIKKGLLSRKDFDKYLKSLDDVADKGVYGHPEEEPDDDDDIDEPEADEAGAEGNSTH
jgi:hypothetical protein